MSKKSDSFWTYVNIIGDLYLAVPTCVELFILQRTKQNKNISFEWPEQCKLASESPEKTLF